MLVFISDLHLTDGTTSNTINAEAFREFADSLLRIISKPESKISELKVVLLGDIFDLIRSKIWLNTTIRPWSEGTEKDEKNLSLEDFTKKIFQGIKENPNNISGIDFLKELKTKAPQGLPVSFQYLIGNHDWLLNRFPEIRFATAEFLGLDEPENYQTLTFPEDSSFTGYPVFARHGDKYDWLNHDGLTRDGSSLGDAMVIDLLTKFPGEVDKFLGEKNFHDPILIKRLLDIESVRPLYMLPVWLDSVCRKSASPRASDYVKCVWNKLVREYFKIPFVTGHNSWGPDKFDLFEKIFLLNPGWVQEKALKFIDEHFPTDYKGFAKKEAGVWKGDIRYVVYGHTHDFQITPIGCYQDGEKDVAEIYFNSGTWRKIMQKTQTVDGTADFVGWRVMTSVIFYKDGERKGRPFEVLNGALGMKA